MPKEGEHQIVTIAELPRLQSERFVSAYTNHIEATPGPYDLSLIFCQILKDSQDQTVVERHAGIAMTWEHAVRLRDLFGRMIDAYEREKGKIRVIEDTPPPQEQPE